MAEEINKRRGIVHLTTDPEGSIRAMREFTDHQRKPCEWTMALTVEEAMCEVSNKSLLLVDPDLAYLVKDVQNQVVREI
jgi:hypothetical protein